MDDNELERAYEAGVLGEHIDVWLKSQIGQYVLQQRAETERKVLDLFRKLDPSDTSAVSELQRALNAAYTGVQWLMDAVDMGQQYIQLLKAEKETYE